MAEAQFRGGPHTIANGRLTLETGVPISSSDQADATTIYYTPYIGNQLGIFDGTNWVVHQFPEISLSLSGLTASTPYDIFAEISGNAVALASVAWTDDTNRATALVAQDGVYCLTGTLTRRYLGTIYIDATGGETNDTQAIRHVWNYYNRVPRSLRVFDATDTWTYSTASFQQANASTANQVDVVVGVNEDPVSLDLHVTMSHDSASGTGVVAIGLDSTSARATDSTAALGGNGAAANGIVSMAASFRGMIGEGQHLLTWLEYGHGTGVNTWYGDNNSVSRSGLIGTILA